MDKRQMRQGLRSRIGELSAERREVASQEIFAEIALLPEFTKSRVIALYYALPDEPQSTAFISEWYKHKRIVLPRVEGDIMQFYDYNPEQITPGSFGINEPLGNTPCPPEQIDLMIVPGVGFTTDGKRMGRGKGFYDKYLAQSGFRASTIGVCFKVQIVDNLPVEKFDREVDKVIAR